MVGAFAFIVMAVTNNSSKNQNLGVDWKNMIPSCTGTSDESTMALLANPDKFFDTLQKLYLKYGSEIAAFRPEMRTWCQRTASCKFTDYEAEMLYMLIREHKPQYVFEMAPNAGFSSHWILQALHKNDDSSTLHSFDIHDNSIKHMTGRFRKRWKFTLGDYAQLYDKNLIDMQQYDFIFIDALHEPDFARGYCQRLLSNHRHPSTIVAIHDIVADKSGGGRESSEVFKYLAFANNARFKFTMSMHAMPNLLYAPQTDFIVPKLNQLRANLGIVKPCDLGENASSSSSTTATTATTSGSCSDVMHDVLYFENNSAPTLFFQLN
jgi:predicted O-methyltransferase YrrM